LSIIFLIFWAKWFIFANFFVQPWWTHISNILTCFRDYLPKTSSPRIFPETQYFVANDCYVVSIVFKLYHSSFTYATMFFFKSYFVQQFNQNFNKSLSIIFVVSKSVRTICPDN
jgi:hypothetical protein